MDVETVAALALAVGTLFNFMLLYYEAHKKPRRKRRWWMTSIHRNRTTESMENMFVELLSEPSGEFKNFCRMSTTDFEFLLCKVTPIISKQDTDWRKAIPAKVRLAVTLRFLATGDSYKSLHFLFKISSQIISEIIPEVCAAINTTLKDEIKMPSTVEEWLKIEKGFKNFPHCIGAIDGKHVLIQCPANSGSEFYNYKKNYSIVLMALVDSNYSFIFADVGSQGRISDGGVFRNTMLWRRISSDNCNFPPESALPQSTTSVPYVFIADGAFPLNTHIMKPYPGNHHLNSPKRIFNYKLSSSRAIVENIFGVMTSVFRFFRRPIPLEPHTALIITMSCILLHNFLRRSKNSQNLYTPPGAIDTYDEEGNLVQPGSWRQELNDNAIVPMRPMSRRAASNALEIRDKFTSYFFYQCNRM